MVTTFNLIISLLWIIIGVLWSFNKKAPVEIKVVLWLAIIIICLNQLGGC